MKYLILFAVFWQTLQVTAYTHSTQPTASGVMPKVGYCAVDKINGEWVDFGTEITLPDGRTMIVMDRFGDGRNNACDIFMEREDECIKWGRRIRDCMIKTP